MFQKLIITEDLTIDNFLVDLNCDLYLTKPSSKAKNPIENCKFAFSHLESKKVYGHQIIVSLLSCDGLTLPYFIDIYNKETMSKIKLAQDLIKGLTKEFNNFIVLADSWYSSRVIFDASSIGQK
ncbi:MAG: hypothetical protein ACRDD2_12055 [Sarcina sp.]